MSSVPNEESVIIQLNSASDSEPDVKVKSRSRSAVSTRSGESVPLISTSGGQTASDEEEPRNVFDDREFTALVRTGEEAIRHGILPQRISQGSSGSYFVRNIDEVSCSL